MVPGNRDSVTYRPIASADERQLLEAVWNESLCGRQLEGLQLMRKIVRRTQPGWECGKGNFSLIPVLGAYKARRSLEH